MNDDNEAPGEPDAGAVQYLHEGLLPPGGGGAQGEMQEMRQRGLPRLLQREGATLALFV